MSSVLVTSNRFNPALTFGRSPVTSPLVTTNVPVQSTINPLFGNGTNNLEPNRLGTPGATTAATIFGGTLPSTRSQPSTFSNILGNTSNTSIFSGFSGADSLNQAFTAASNAQSFKPVTNTNVQAFSPLQNKGQPASPLNLGGPGQSVADGLSSIMMQQGNAGTSLQAQAQQPIAAPPAASDDNNQAMQMIMMLLMKVLKSAKSSKGKKEETPVEPEKKDDKPKTSDDNKIDLKDIKTDKNKETKTDKNTEIKTDKNEETPPPNTDEKKVDDTKAPEVESNQDLGAFSPEQKEFLGLVNKARADKGLKPVKLNAKLNAAATKHSGTMARENNMDHEAGGTKFNERIGAEGYTGARAENIAMGAEDAKGVFDMWMNSEGHRNNILMDDATEIGLGRAGNFWTQTVGNA